MENSRTGRHCVFMLHAHLVFVTKYRGRVFAAEHLAKLEEIARGVCEQFEVQLVEFNGEQDHVHMLVNFPPKVALSKLVNSLKGVTSRKLKMYFPEVMQPAWQGNALWSASYFTGSVGGAPLHGVRRYIEQQDRPT